MNRKFLNILITAVLCLAGGLTCSGAEKCSDRAALRRFQRLENSVRKGTSHLPSDMVVYRYENDTLRSWVNSFPLREDDVNSPLRFLSDSALIYNLGGRKYLAKAVETRDSSGNRHRVIYALEIADRSSGKPRGGELRLKIFSPILYAGSVFHSLGEVLVLNTLILLVSILLLIFRRRVKLPRWAASAASVLLFLYVFLLIRSITRNSDICLELYRLSEITPYSGLVYISLVLTLICSTLLLKASGVDIYSRGWRAMFATVIGIFLVGSAWIFGAPREKDRLSVWAERLSIDRDIVLEMQLKSSEQEIASDPVIAQMIREDTPEAQISGYLVETYLPSLVQEYDIAVLSLRGSVNDPGMESVFLESLQGGESIAAGSRYLYANSGAGRIRYTALFVYYDEDCGRNRLLVGIEAKANNEGKGYASILGVVAPGRVVMPPIYSYAKYNDDGLQFFKGNYPYPMKLNESLYGKIYVDKASRLRQDGYVHFPTLTGDDELVFVSRPVIRPFNYLVAASFVAVLALLLLYCISRIWEREHTGSHSDYYRNRIAYVMMSSLSLTLVAMMFVSIFFVSRRNNANMHTLMSDKINSIRSLMETQFRTFPAGGDGIRGQEAMSILKNVKEIAETDISLYDGSGKIIMSTVPEGFDRMVLDVRMNADAYARIIDQNRRYCVLKNNIRGKVFYSMYAPMLNSKGELLAIICAPYADDSFDFRRDAVMHGAGIMTVFVILLLLMRLLSVMVLDRMFKPLSVMSAKMNSADLTALEHIEYDRDDEVASLVTAYNRMVDDLSESSRKLALAERDKAWTGMARQVAHEIKNPLTPMKLQLQRLIRLKQKGDPSWQEKFDEVSRIVLDHIDILADTAGEFSMIAKLTTEERTLIDLGKLLPEELSMFDSREGVVFEYLGLDTAVVSGPRPQLARVVVNLLTNAVQAVEGLEDAKVLLSLRNSVKDGYYDIVVEDNGPGVSADNEERLFTPNFTTKSGGSGLGLAISRSILDNCGASIEYSRSFVLGGACFIVRYPKAEA